MSASPCGWIFSVGHRLIFMCCTPKTILIYYVIYTRNYIQVSTKPYTVYGIPFYLLYYLFCSICLTICFILNTMYYVLCTMDYGLWTMYYGLRTLYYVHTIFLYILYTMYYSMYFILCVSFCLLYTIYVIFSIYCYCIHLFLHTVYYKTFFHILYTL